jgi:hypothetical protein
MDALTGVSHIVARHATICSVDADCLLVDTSLPCQDNCAGAILVGHAGAFRSELDRYAAGICPTLPATCGFGPSCAAPIQARCANGACRPAFAGQ